MLHLCMTYFCTVFLFYRKALNSNSFQYVRGCIEASTVEEAWRTEESQKRTSLMPEAEPINPFVYPRKKREVQKLANLALLSKNNFHSP